MTRKIMILMLIIQSTTVLAQNQLFDQLIAEKFKSDEPGGTVLVARKGNVIYKHAFGMASLELDVKMKPDMVFQIGSMTKQFTAVCILQLMEQGKLKLNDPLSRYLDGLAPEWATVTLEHLLTHTSGIPELQVDQATPIAELGNLSKSKPMLFPAGSKMLYNNTGYAMLGHVIERVAKIPYPDYLQKNIILPLGMDHTYYNVNNRIFPGYVPAYIKKRNFINFKGGIPVSAAGALLSNTEDLLKWNLGLVSGKIIGKETLKKAWTSYHLSDGKAINYGYGWAIGGSIQGSAIVEHGGISGGYMAYGIYLPIEEIYIAVFVNQRGVLHELLATEFAAIALGKPDMIKPIPVTDTVLQSYSGLYRNPENSERRITFNDHNLYYQQADNLVLKMIPYAADKFFFENTTILVQVNRDNDRQLKSITFYDKKYMNTPRTTLVKVLN